MPKIEKIYNCPLYYEIAFSFRNVEKEVEFLEKCIKKFSKIKVKNILEIACGPSPYLLELDKRGYNFTGLDINENMLKYSLNKAKENSIEIDIINNDMIKFKTKRKFDFIFCMLGSVVVKTNNEFLSHLNSIANCLKSGGLYLLEGNIKFILKPVMQKWTIKKYGIKITTIWKEKLISFIEQTALQTGVMKIKKDGEEKILKESMELKYIFPQEFLELLKINKRFEFLGWYDNFNLNKEVENIKKFSRIITVLRRK